MFSFYFSCFKIFLAEAERFELSDHLTTIGNLANCWFKPTHPSFRFRILLSSSVRKSRRYRSKLYNTDYFIFLIFIIFANSSSTLVTMDLTFGVNSLLRYAFSADCVSALPVTVTVSHVLLTILFLLTLFS